ncbi:MAG: helix-turn-helix domain-containing protein [Azovibrio sp.]|nr:helix-turn-helix domain-containing protein [Azovibrio sp.]
MNLQQSLQVTSPLGEFDSHLLLALLVMVVAGVLGGLANHYLAERQAGAALRQDWRRYLVFGVVTALTTPLLLNMLSSNLLEGARTRPGELYVFAAFCLIYVVAARRIFENPAAFYQQQLDQVRRELEQLRREQEAMRLKLEAVPAAPTPAELAPDKAESRSDPREVVTYNDVEILRALADESYVYGNLAALTEKTGLGRELISQRLAVLKNVGLIDTRINDKNVLHWVISARGRQVLTDVLTGQDDNKKMA